MLDDHPAAAAACAAIATLLVKHPGIATRSLWLDEAWTAALATHTVPAILRVAAHDTNPPLYNLLVAGWAHAFGTSELALRLPSLLAAAACAALLLLFVRRFYGAEAALTAALLYVVSPSQTWHATEARAYTVVGLLCIASFHLYLSLLAAPRRSTALALGVVNAAGLYTHYTIGLAWLAQAACAPLVARAHDRRRALRTWIGSQLLAGVLFAPFATSLVANAPAAESSWLPRPGWSELVQTAIDLAGSRAALGAAAALVTGWVVWRLLCLRRGEPPTLADRRIAVALAWAVIPVAVAFLVSQRTPILLARYELFAGVGWIVALAAVSARLPWPAVARGALAVGLVFLSATTLPDTASRDPAWRELAARVRQAADDRTMVVLVPSVDCIPLAYYVAPDLLPSIFGPRGSTQPVVLQRRLAERGILCRDAAWPASGARLDGDRLVLVVARPEKDDGGRVLRHAAAQGYAIDSSQELAGKTIHVLSRRTSTGPGRTRDAGGS